MSLLQTKLELERQLEALREVLGREGVPLEYSKEYAALHIALNINYQHIAAATFRIFERLPNCTECGKKAFFVLGGGPYYCETCAQQYTTAQKVTWYDDLKLLGANILP